MTTAAAHTDEVIDLDIDDGVPCNLVHVRGAGEPAQGPVLLVHGVGVRRSPSASTPAI